MTDRQILELAEKFELAKNTMVKDPGDNFTHITTEGMKILAFAYHLLDAQERENKK
jgi:hypothetical protein